MSKTVFAVEDDALTAEQVRLYVEEMGYAFAGRADTADAALEQIDRIRPDLVLMDVRLKGPVDGVEVASQILQDYDVAVLYLTAYADSELLARAMHTGPYGYLVKPFSRESLQAAIAMAIQKFELNKIQQRIFEGVVGAMTELVKLHDMFLGEVQVRAAELARGIARELRLPREKANGVRLASQLHAIGLVAMPIEFLFRDKPLQGVARAHFQSHPEIAWRLLKDIEFPWPVAEMVRQHMERLDGSGFPHALGGSEMLPEARIVAVACAAAKMITPCGRQPALDIDDAVEALEAGRGTRFDAGAVDACVRVLRMRKEWALNV